MGDFNIDVGFNTNELKAATAGASGSGGGAGGTGSSSGFAKAIKAGLMATGIIGILMNLKPILETIGFLVGVIGSFMGFLIAQLIQFIIPFFKDPFRALMQLGIFIVNGIITGIEFLMNAILGVLTFGKVGGFGENKIELPRFQEEIILDAYDKVTEVSDALAMGDATASDLRDAQADFRASFLNSFMTASEFQDFKISQEEKLSTTKSATDNAYDSMIEAMNYANKKFSDLVGGSFTPVESVTSFENPAVLQESRKRPIQDILGLNSSAARESSLMSKELDFSR